MMKKTRSTKSPNRIPAPINFVVGNNTAYDCAGKISASLAVRARVVRLKISPAIPRNHTIRTIVARRRTFQQLKRDKY